MWSYVLSSLLLNFGLVTDCCSQNISCYPRCYALQFFASRPFYIIIFLFFASILPLILTSFCCWDVPLLLPKLFVSNISFLSLQTLAFHTNETHRLLIMDIYFSASDLCNIWFWCGPIWNAFHCFTCFRAWSLSTNQFKFPPHRFQTMNNRNRSKTVYTPWRPKRPNRYRDSGLRRSERRHVSSVQNSRTLPVITIKTFTGKKLVSPSQHLIDQLWH